VTSDLEEAMTTPCATSLRPAAALLAAAVLLCAVSPASAQTSAKEAHAPFVVSKTPWGDPDLQGTWTTDSAYSIPAERPATFGTRAELTDKEFQEKADRVARRQAIAKQGGSGNIPAMSQDAAWMTRAFRQTSLIVEPPDGRMPAMTPAELERAVTAPTGTYGNGPLDSPEDFNLYERCITLGVVGSMLPKIYGNGHRILQAPGYVAIMNEMVHEARIVPVDGRPFPGEKIKMYMGASRGHWEGGTLVVETRNLNGKSIFLNEGQKLVERFTRVEADLLRYEVTIDNPQAYTKRIRISIPLTSPPGYQVLSYNCHEGNYALLQALGGERAEDRALEEDRRKGIIRPRRPIQDGLGIAGSPASEPIPELTGEP
jgi:hypothetical protein